MSDRSTDDQYGGLPAAYTGMQFPDRVLHLMRDPELVVAEYRGVIGLKTGGAYNNRYCGIFRVRDGLIVHFTEYFDPIVLRQSFGDGNALDQTFSLDR